MSSQEEFDRNRKCHRAVQYLMNLLECGTTNRPQLRRANRYNADKFKSTMRIFE